MPGDHEKKLPTSEVSYSYALFLRAYEVMSVTFLRAYEVMSVTFLRAYEVICVTFFLPQPEFRHLCR